MALRLHDQLDHDYKKLWKIGLISVCTNGVYILFLMSLFARNLLLIGPMQSGLPIVFLAIALAQGPCLWWVHQYLMRYHSVRVLKRSGRIVIVYTQHNQRQVALVGFNPLHYFSKSGKLLLGLGALPSILALILAALWISVMPMPVWTGIILYSLLVATTVVYQTLLLPKKRKMIAFYWYSRDILSTTMTPIRLCTRIVDH